MVDLRVFVVGFCEIEEEQWSWGLDMTTNCNPGLGFIA